MTLLALLLILSEPVGAAATDASASRTLPWFDREGCKAAAAAVLAADFELADRRLSEIEKSADPDDGACGVWVRLVASELRLAILGRTPEALDERRRRLTRLFQFARAHGSRGQRFGDLEIEARTRRVRVLMDDGDRTGALAEARRTRTMLAERTGEPTPTLHFTKGVINLAIAYESWAMRTLLGMAGLEGDAELGKANVLKLVDGENVYKYEGTYVAHHFAFSEPKGVLGAPVRYAASLAQAFPTNPQLAGDYAEDLLAEGRFKEALAVLEPLSDAIKRSSTAWGSRSRARVLGLHAKAMIAAGDSDKAKDLFVRARAEGDVGLQDLLAEIEKKLTEKKL